MPKTGLLGTFWILEPMNYFHVSIYPDEVGFSHNLQPRILAVIGESKVEKLSNFV